ncbi:MAG: prolyl oligopeptidase family serine peptidase [Ignavibacteriaceae bacterium]
MSKDFVLNTSRNDKLRITVFGENSLGQSPCIILVHGFKGFKDWGFCPFIGEYLSSRNFFVITFNFSHNGIGKNLTEFTELDKFAENTFSLEISELSEIITAYKNNYFGESNNQPVGLLGHSRGGGISLLTSKQNDNVKAVAVWASVSDFDRYSQRQKEVWRKKGVFEVLNTRTKQVMRLNVCLLDDLEQNKDTTLNIENAVKKLNKPLFIAHGEQDLAVPVKEAETIYSWSDKDMTEFYKIPGTGHTFNAKHPFEGSDPRLDSLLEKTERFFKNNLN